MDRHGGMGDTKPPTHRYGHFHGHYTHTHGHSTVPQPQPTQPRPRPRPPPPPPRMPLPSTQTHTQPRALPCSFWLAANRGGVRRRGSPGWPHPAGERGARPEPASAARGCPSHVLHIAGNGGHVAQPHQSGRSPSAPYSLSPTPPVSHTHTRHSHQDSTGAADSGTGKGAREWEGGEREVGGGVSLPATEHQRMGAETSRRGGGYSGPRPLCGDPLSAAARRGWRSPLQTAPSKCLTSRLHAHAPHAHSPGCHGRRPPFAARRRCHKHHRLRLGLCFGLPCHARSALRLREHDGQRLAAHMHLAAGGVGGGGGKHLAAHMGAGLAIQRAARLAVNGHNKVRVHPPPGQCRAMPLHESAQAPPCARSCLPHARQWSAPPSPPSPCLSASSVST